MPAEKDPAPFAVDRGHSEGSGREIGCVVEVNKYGGMWRIVVKTKRGQLNLAAEVVRRADPIDALALLE
jgi:hypothetical protein